MSNKKTIKKGFTLIELLVVIAIIGILSSVVLASLNSARRLARDARRVSDIKQLQIALQMYFEKNGEYPDALDQASLVDNGFMPAVPQDPLAGNYDYDNLADDGSACAVATGDCLMYHLGANLEDSNNPNLDSDIDACSAADSGCSKILSGTTLSGIDDGGTTGNDCVGTATNVYCYDITP